MFPDYDKEADGLFDDVKKFLLDFEMLGVFEIKKTKSKYYGEDIDSLRLSSIGKKVISLALLKTEFDTAEEIKNKNKILPQIKFKYIKLVDEDGKRPVTKGTICAYCGKEDIVYGGGIDAHTNNPKIICEDCAIDRYMEFGGYVSREAAASHRRRIFDVSYLFREMITDIYMKENKINNFDDIDEDTAEFITEMAGNLWNERLSKEEKERLEKIVDQKEIERELKKLMN